MVISSQNDTPTEILGLREEKRIVGRHQLKSTSHFPFKTCAT